MKISYWDIKKGMRFIAVGVGKIEYEVLKIRGDYAVVKSDCRGKGRITMHRDTLARKCIAEVIV